MRIKDCEVQSGLIAVVDDDPSLSRLVSYWLQRADFQVDVYRDGEAALEGLQHTLPDVVCLDLHMPGMNGLEALQRIKALHPDMPVLMLTSETNVNSVVAAMQAGAYDYLTKPLDSNKLVTVVRNAFERRRLQQRVATLQREASGGGYPGIVGESAPMRALFREIDRIAASDVTVLIHGESGTGKELVARALHANSPRADAPFVALNCAAIPETLQESELFGHEKGSFTGATGRHIGRFEQAHTGTLFLDEVAELSAALQAKLLRVIQERRFHRVGGTREVRSDFRLLAATHRDLAEAAADGRFREDLFFRIAVFELELPALRERGTDLDTLVAHFTEKFSTGDPPQMREAAQLLVRQYRWPGNVRELENAVRRACVLARDGWIEPEHLPPRVRRGSRVEPSVENGESPGDAVTVGVLANGTLPIATLAQLERRAIMESLERNVGNISAVGRELGIGRTSLYRKLAKYELR